MTADSGEAARSEPQFSEERRRRMLEDVRAGLSRPRKQVPSTYFYDERGSELFERITRLPEYYPTRTERALLEAHVPAWFERLRPRSILELGAGSAEKTRVLLEAMRRERSGPLYAPVDVSAGFLEDVVERLRDEYPTLHVAPVVADISADLDVPADLPRPAIFAFLGSTIGNFTMEGAAELLGRVREAMAPSDRLLLGVDLQKDVARIEAAYNDAQGVSAEFNHNMLRVLNRELGADFDQTAFRHWSFYNRDGDRMETHLVSTRDQRVRIPGIGTVELEDGESIRTELSHKYTRERIDELFADAGLTVADWATDPDDLYALVLGTGR